MDYITLSNGVKMPQLVYKWVVTGVCGAED